MIILILVSPVFLLFSGILALTALIDLVHRFRIHDKGGMIPILAA